MPITIDEAGALTNTAGPKDNPRELESYEHAIAHTIATDSEVVAWSAVGNFPSGLTMNPLTGEITGTIDAMFDQPLCTPKKTDEYLEVDCRNYPDKNGRYINDTFVFKWTTTLNYLGPLPAPPNTPKVFPMIVTEDHSITLVKNHGADGLLMAKEVLDGDGTRLPYHCKCNGPQNEAQCTAINGTWDATLEKCSIVMPVNQTDCTAIGATWEEKSAGAGDFFCNTVLIQTEAECTAIGGVWTKNTMWVAGVEYDNYADYKTAAGL